MPCESIITEGIFPVVFRPESVTFFQWPAPDLIRYLIPISASAGDDNQLAYSNRCTLKAAVLLQHVRSVGMQISASSDFVHDQIEGVYDHEGCYWHVDFPPTASAAVKSSGAIKQCTEDHTATHLKYKGQRMEIIYAAWCGPSELKRGNKIVDMTCPSSSSSLELRNCSYRCPTLEDKA